MIYRRYVKRLMDIICSGVGLLALLPIFIIISIAIRINSRGSVFFTQDRIGEHGKMFKLFKFRTMLTFEDSFYSDGTPIANYDRITVVGNVLRKTSIDELPQLINILIGNMSIVGPRPTLPYQVERYNENQLQRLNVKPGLTGLAQVNGRNKLTWEEKIEYDLEYINKISFSFDVKIILKTLFVVFRSEKVEFMKHDEISTHVNDIRKDVGGK